MANDDYPVTIEEVLGGMVLAVELWEFQDTGKKPERVVAYLKDNIVNQILKRRYLEMWPRLAYFLDDSCVPEYTKEFGDDIKCASCGHAFYRHFDSYENMKPVGCKYCTCACFRKEPGNGTVLPEDQRGPFELPG